jgi:hypothetical protein
MSAREWILLAARKKLAVLRETEPTWLPDYAVAESKPLHAASLIALTFALVREISGEAKVDRLQHAGCDETHVHTTHTTREQAYLRAADERFNGINRCC